MPFTQIRIPAQFAALVALLAAFVGITPTEAVAADAGTAATAASATTSAVPRTGLQTLSPARLLDTRSTGGALSGGSARKVQVLGRGGVPSTGVGSVAVNVTAIKPTAAGWLTAWPTGTSKPATSSVNFPAGAVVANAIVSGVGSDGTISIYNQAGSTNVVVDVTGWFPSGSGVTGITPTRVLDTRQLAETRTTGITSTTSRTVAVRGTVVPTSAIAVTANVTATTASDATTVVVHPSGTANPGTTTLHVAPGQTIANSTFATLGSDGALTVSTSTGSVHTIIDVTGYLTKSSGYVALPTPVRVGDTRSGSYWHDGGYSRAGKATADSVDTFSVVKPKQSTTPTLPWAPGAAVVTMSVISPTAAGWGTAWPYRETKGTTSSLNYASQGTVANSAIVGTPDGMFDFQVSSGVAADVTVDVQGYFPSDGVGLLTVGATYKDYANGTDKIGVAFCEASGMTSLNRTQIITNLNGPVRAWFVRQSRGRYAPTFYDAGKISVASTDKNCIDKLSTKVTGGNAALGIIGQERNPYSAYGSASSGKGTGSRAYPTNVRHGQVTASAVYKFGNESPFYNIAVHELGHMLDWPHSHLGGAGDYSNVMDVMSGSPAQYEGKFVPQGTSSLNRLRSGWVDGSEVVVHKGGTATYYLAPVTATGTQLIAVPSGTPGKFMTLGARVKSGDDRYIDKAGVEVDLVQERSGSTGSGLATRQSPAWGSAGSTSHVLGAGQSKTLGPVTIKVGALRSDGRYPVTITGTGYDFTLS